MSQGAPHRYGAPTALAPRQTGVPIPFTSGVLPSSVHSRKYAAGQPSEINGIRVFKTGTFKDSMGFESTWTDSHLSQMVYHFDYLKEQGIFPNVPLRADHSSSVNGVVGYIKRLFIDPTDSNFLAADLDVTEPDAFDKWERGTYRARSLEVGVYETNDGALYYPTVFGLAFVDIPAVEGLYSAGRNGSRSYHQVITDQEEPPMSTNRPTSESASGEPPADEPPADEPPADTPPAATPPADAPPAATPPAVAPPADAPPADHSHAGATNTFQVNGAPVADFGAVQAHITALEEFRRTSIEQSRRDTVARWAREGRITQPQVDSLVAVALTMNETQYEAFASSYEAAPPSSIIGRHVSDGSGAQNEPPKPADSEFDVLVETLKNHRRSQMSGEKIKATKTYAKFLAACSARGESPESHFTL